MDIIAAVGPTATSRDPIPSEWRVMAIKATQERTTTIPDSHFLPEDVFQTLQTGISGDDPILRSSYRLAFDLIWGREATGRPLESIMGGINHEEKMSLMEFMSNVEESTRHRKFASTKSKRLGLVRTKVKPKDLICILLGCSVPVILRKEGEKYTLMGEAYVHDFMDGKGMFGLDSGLYFPEEFAIK